MIDLFAHELSRLSAWRFSLPCVFACSFDRSFFWHSASAKDAAILFPPRIYSRLSLFLEQIGDLYDAEQRLLKALPKMAEASTSPELRQAFESHLGETKGQGRVEQRYRFLLAECRAKNFAPNRKPRSHNVPPDLQGQSDPHRADLGEEGG